jgi:hypothetical protein
MSLISYHLYEARFRMATLVTTSSLIALVILGGVAEAYSAVAMVGIYVLDGALVLWLLYRSATIGVVISDEEIFIRNVLTTRRVPTNENSASKMTADSLVAYRWKTTTGDAIHLPRWAKTSSG